VCVCAYINRWSASTSTVSAPPGVRACGPASVVKMECQTSSDDDYALLTSRFGFCFFYSIFYFVSIVCLI